MRELFRDGRFRLLFGAQVTSMAADSILLIVLAIWIKELTGSDGMAGAVILAVAAPMLLSPLLGWMVDRVRRRPFLVFINVASAAALVPLLAVRSPAGVWIVFAVAVAYGLSLVLNAAGLAGLIKEMVQAERLADANGTLRTNREGMRLIGPLAGAGLYAVAGVAAVVGVAVTMFLIAAALLAAIRIAEQRRVSGKLRLVAELSAGFRHVFTDALLRRVALAIAAAFLVFGTVQAGVFAYVDRGLGRPATFVAVLMTAMGIGSAVGGLLAPQIIRRVGGPPAVAFGLAGVAAGMGGLVYPQVVFGFVAAPLVGIGVSLIAVSFATLMQLRTPGQLMARVSTATDLLIGGPQTASIAAGAALVSVVDYRWMFATTAAALVVIAVTLLATPSEPVQVATLGATKGRRAVSTSQ